VTGFQNYGTPIAQSRFVERFRRLHGSLTNHISFDYVGKKNGVLPRAMSIYLEFIFQSSRETIQLENFKNLKIA